MSVYGETQILCRIRISCNYRSGYVTFLNAHRRCPFYFVGSRIRIKTPPPKKNNNQNNIESPYMMRVDFSREWASRKKTHIQNNLEGWHRPRYTKWLNISFVWRQYIAFSRQQCARVFEIEKGKQNTHCRCQRRKHCCWTVRILGDLNNNAKLCKYIHWDYIETDHY